ncbi:MAG: hypothetical protein ACI3W5_15895 [Faecousia sp.]
MLVRYRTSFSAVVDFRFRADVGIGPYKGASHTVGADFREIYEKAGEIPITKLLCSRFRLAASGLFGPKKRPVGCEHGSFCRFVTKLCRFVTDNRKFVKSA